MPFLKTSDIKTGDIILEETAWIWTFPTRAESKTVCNRCFRRSADFEPNPDEEGLHTKDDSRNGSGAAGLKRCASCRFATYCSKECQVEDWAARHKYECFTIKKLGGSDALDFLTNQQKLTKPSKAFIGESHTILLQMANSLLTVAQALVDSAAEEDEIENLDLFGNARRLIDLDRAVPDGVVYGSEGVSATVVLPRDLRNAALSEIRQWTEEHNDVVRRILPATVPLYDYADFGKTSRWTANRFTRPLALAVCNGELAQFLHSCYKPNAVLINEGRLVRMIATDDINRLNDIRLLRTPACDWGAEPRLTRGGITQTFFGYNCKCEACGDSVTETLDGQMYQVKCPAKLADGSDCGGEVGGPPNEVLQIVCHKAANGEPWDEWARIFNGQCNRCHAWGADSYGLARYKTILLAMGKMHQTVQQGVPPSFFRQFRQPLSDVSRQPEFLEQGGPFRKMLFPPEIEPYIASNNVLVSDYLMGSFRTMLSMSKSPLSVKEMCNLANMAMFLRIKFVYRNKFALTNLWSIIDNMKMGVAIGTGRDEPGARDHAVQLIENFTAMALGNVLSIFPAHQAALIEANLLAEKAELIKDIDDSERKRQRRQRRRHGR